MTQSGGDVAGNHRFEETGIGPNLPDGQDTQPVALVLRQVFLVGQRCRGVRDGPRFCQLQSLLLPSIRQFFVVERTFRVAQMLVRELLYSGSQFGIVI